MMPVSGWALVVGCLTAAPNDECVSQLVSGFVWNTEAQCNIERDREQVPGAECLEIEGIIRPDENDAPGISDVLEELEAKARETKL